MEKHEVKQMVKLSTPDSERHRAEYLAEIGMFKDMIRDCSLERSHGSTEISVEEIQDCLKNYVSLLKSA